MAFAPGMYAFPGGSVDPADYLPADRPGGDTEDPDAPAGGLRMGLADDAARAVHRAAVREVAEEAGVRLSVAGLRAWARWLTPEFEQRRFDTFFFVAAMPEGQHARGETAESDHAVWLAAEEAMALPMMPPTRHMIRGLAGYSTVESALAASTGRDLSEPVQPVVEVDADGAWLRLS
jgi:8-oxo-dGTP pyrophosphatase MutT (NUDIX family)